MPQTFAEIAGKRFYNKYAVLIAPTEDAAISEAIEIKPSTYYTLLATTMAAETAGTAITIEIFDPTTREWQDGTYKGELMQLKRLREVVSIEKTALIIRLNKPETIGAIGVSMATDR